MTTELLARARAGDGEAFWQLVEPHRHELQVHCYRVLGSQADAEDLLQETLLAAWQGLPGFAERASLRSWLYRIATNRCLNWLRSASRRMSVEAASLPVEQPEPPGAARSPGSSPTLTRCWMRRAIPSPGLRSVTRGARRSHSPYL